MDAHPTPDVPLMPFRPLRTLRFAVVVAIGFLLFNFAISDDQPQWRTWTGWAHAYGISLVFALCTSFSVELLFAAQRSVLGAHLPPQGTRLRTLIHWCTPPVALAVALPAAALLTGMGKDLADVGRMYALSPSNAVFFLLQAALFYGYFALRRRQLRAEKLAANAQLRLLQAQMEPHFLFNTLANVVSLMEADTPRARAMLESFTDYLRASLVSLRTPEHALGVELDLVDAYLRVVKVRMDDRLHYRIDVPDELRSRRVPALSLQPLIENAIVHGLEPKIEGGQVVVTARAQAGRLTITVTDDGLGAAPVAGGARRSAGTGAHRGSGTALNNIRERLKQAHGDRGRLLIEPALPHGTRATLSLPLQP